MAKAIPRFLTAELGVEYLLKQTHLCISPEHQRQSGRNGGKPFDVS